MKEDYIYTTGQFAKLNNINKRTLHYYDEIGLFHPEYKAENGYRYYTCFQIAQLELILILRKIGLSVEEIRRYVESPSDTALFQMIDEQNKRIRETVRQLTEAGDFLQRKVERLRQGMDSCHGKLNLLRCRNRSFFSVMQ